MFSSPGRPSSAPTPSSRQDFNEAPSRSRSPVNDPDPTSASRVSGTPPNTLRDGGRRGRQGRPDGKGRHPRAQDRGPQLPPQPAQVGTAAWPADLSHQRQSFTWWAGASGIQDSGPPLHDPREHRGQALLPLTDAGGGYGRQARVALHPIRGVGPAPPPSLTLTICLTCGQPILQPAGQPPTPGTQPLPVGSSHQAAAERIGWRYLQAAISQLQSHPRTARDLGR